MHETVRSLRVDNLASIFDSTRLSRTCKRLLRLFQCNNSYNGGSHLKQKMTRETRQENTLSKAKRKRHLNPAECVQSNDNGGYQNIPITSIQISPYQCYIQGFQASLRWEICSIFIINCRCVKIAYTK